MLDLRGCKKKRICLIDVDSSIPNLALMKLSTYFKKKKFKVDLIQLNYSGYPDKKKEETKIIDGKEYDKVFVSILFLPNKDAVKVINCKEVHCGGTGYNFRKKLPEKVEHLYPDYNLYAGNEYSIGYITRGCIRNCKFCFVRKKEGMLHIYASIKDFYNPKLPKIMLLDNNFLALPEEKCLEFLRQLKKTGKKITFKQGLDFRLLTENKIKALIDLNYDGEFIFAFDNPLDKPIIERNLKLWKRFVGNWKTKFYVLIGFESTLKQDLDRVYFLRKNKCLPYIMRHTNCYTSPNKPFYTDLASWCNQPGLFKNMPFKTFIDKRHATKERKMQTMKIIEDEGLKII
ncbi:hypothetical protein J4474_01850 [Candidatus Pacearchaeota archaeon]|nr:hypothetical protein [Candidatus Pacearchaeota archaeon]